MIVTVSSTVLHFQVMVPLGTSIRHQQMCVEVWRNVPDSLKFLSKSLRPEVSSSCTLPLEETDRLLVVVSTVGSAIEMKGRQRQWAENKSICDHVE